MFSLHFTVFMNYMYSCLKLCENKVVIVDHFFSNSHTDICTVTVQWP